MNSHKLAIWLAVLAFGAAIAPSRGAEPPTPLLEIPTTEGSIARVNSQWMSFTPSGQNLVIRFTPQEKLNADADLKIYNATTAKKIASLSIPSGEAAGIRPAGTLRPVCAIGPRDEWVAYAQDGMVKFLSVPAGQKSLPNNGATKSIKLLPATAADQIWIDRQSKLGYLATTWPHGSYAVYDWSVSDRPVARKVIFGKCRRLWAVAMSTTHHRFVAAVELDKKEPQQVLECWTLADKPTKAVIPQDTEVSSLALSSPPLGNILAVGYPDGSVAWYDLTTNKLLNRMLPICRFTVATVAFHPSGKYLACGSYDKAGQPNLFLIDLFTEKVAVRLSADPRGVADVCFSPAGDRLATFGSSGVVKIWDVNVLLNKP